MSVIICVRGAIFRNGRQNNKNTATFSEQQIDALVSINSNIIEKINKYKVYTIIDVVTSLNVKKLLYSIFKNTCIHVRIKRQSKPTQILSLIDSFALCHSKMKNIDMDISGILMVRGDLKFTSRLPLPMFDFTSSLQMPWQISDKFRSFTKSGNIRVCDTFFYTSNSYDLVMQLQKITHETTLHDIADLVHVDLLVKNKKYDSDSAKEKNPYYKIVNRNDFSSIEKKLYHFFTKIDVEIIKACGTIVLCIMFLKKSNIFTGMLLGWSLLENPTHLFARIPRIKLKCHNQPSLIIFNHTNHNYLGMTDVLFSIQIARHLYRETGICTSVVVKNGRFNDVVKNILPVYCQYITGNKRVKKAIEELRKGRNVFLFLVDPKVPKCGGTGVYHILKASGVNYMMYLVEYKKYEIQVRSLTTKYKFNDFDDIPFVQKLTDQYTENTGLKYDLKF